MPNWIVLGGFGKCHPHYRVHIAGSLPLLHSPTDAIFQHRTPSAQDSEPKIAFPKGPIWAQMGPNGPNGLRPHFLRPHQSALDFYKDPKMVPLIFGNSLNPKPYRSLIGTLEGSHSRNPKVPLIFRKLPYCLAGTKNRESQSFSLRESSSGPSREGMITLP